MSDKIHEDIDLDDIMEMVGDTDSDEESTSEHQQSPDDSHVPEKDTQVPEKDSGDSKLVYETLNSNLALKAEVERLQGAKAEAENIALQSVLRNFESQIDNSNQDISRLNQALAEARDEGETAKSIEIETRIRDNYERIRDLKNKVDTYSPMLNQPRQSQAPQREPEGNRMAAEWLKENETWLVDPKNQDKREYANNLFKDMQSNNADMNSLSFWTRFEKKLVEFDHTKSANQTQRMPKNMVTYNAGGNGMNNNKPTSYKQNPDFVKKVAFIAKNLIKNDDLLKDKNMFNSLLKQYHKVYKSGNFKHLPQNMD